jgi:hypothetical protein
LPKYVKWISKGHFCTGVGIWKHRCLQVKEFTWERVPLKVEEFTWEGVPLEVKEFSWKEFP